jgi:hypothetical protein
MRGNRRGPVDSICFWTITLTWPFYMVGALYIVGPAIAWSLLAVVLISFYLGSAIRQDLRVQNNIPLVVWSWIAGMTAMLLVLWIGHLQWGLGFAETVKSTIGWAKGWALAAIFPVIGATLQVQRAPIIRAQSIVGLCTLLLIPVVVPAAYLGLPTKLFVSPLAVVGGPGPEYFSVYLYTLDPETWTPRWQFFAPWSPFAGLLGVAAVIFALEETKRYWLVIGVFGGLAMIVLSKSRMSIIALTGCVLIPRVAPYFVKAASWQLMAGIAASMALFGETVLRLVQNFMQTFKQARASSSRIRDILQRIAYDRWSGEAPWFGHGTVERGTHAVEYMPIGSHHTWFGLLFVKGASGALALFLPMLFQFWVTLVDAARGARGRLPFGIVLLLVILTFGENLEIEVYLFWPSLLLLGIHAREIQTERPHSSSASLHSRGPQNP